MCWIRVEFFRIYVAARSFLQGRTQREAGERRSVFRCFHNPVGQSVLELALSQGVARAAPMDRMRSVPPVRPSFSGSPEVAHFRLTAHSVDGCGTNNDWQPSVTTTGAV